jgi:arabinofuranosyltransferase
VDNTNRLQIEVGRWLATHTAAGATIATNDIGAIAFFSDRRILDLEGIVTPAIVAFKRESRQLEFLETRRPDYLVIFNEWYPHLAARRDLFTEIHRVSVPRVTASHDTLVIYRTPWTRTP